MVAIEISPYYGWVVIATAIGTTITSFYMGHVVMDAREKYNVQLPNLYAVPGFHKNADEFNRIQRGHQNFVEGLVGFVAMSLIGGLKYPIANAIGSVLFCVGSVLYQKGYSDLSLDVKDARMKKGGPVKYIGLLTALYSTGAFAYSLITSA